MRRRFWIGVVFLVLGGGNGVWAAFVVCTALTVLIAVSGHLEGLGHPWADAVCAVSLAFCERVWILGLGCFVVGMAFF
jgi:hypothetical protein